MSSDTGAEPRKITSEYLIEAMVAAGLLGDAVSDASLVHRIVIDITAQEAVMVHVERFGDERLLQVIPSMTGVTVTTGKPAGG